ncbi:MAG: Phosphate-binding protein PstS precursor [Candidatus Accumulibacter adjunctus]|uniref:Phosphate-binding protein n=1 Tax=Candidatus Accumulibacter adjunctus TaxID=1454001 RepID=A0A011NR88_9PROT|nr:MAG: Phosphate-binding protein PstS precursor [Candidatus Accumulibacter adjunctus]
MKQPARHSTTAAVAILGSLVLSPLAFAAPPVVKVDGSSTVFPITEAVAEEFQKARKGATNVTVGISGTGGGFKKFCRGETDIANASRPISKKEMDDCSKAGIRYYELPVAYDALTVMVNPQNTFIKSMTVAELKKIWEPGAQGRINNWKDVNPAWPDQKLKLYGAGADSGTFDYFTEAIVGKAKSSRGDYTASEDDNVLVQGIAGDKGALGYFGFAYYIENQKKLKAVAIDGGKGPIAPTPENVDNGSYQPLSRPIFIYVSEKSLDKPEVRDFVDFYMKNARPLVKEVKYIPLPAKAYSGNLDHIARKKIGTVFGGENETGLTIEELMKREAQL